MGLFKKIKQAAGGTDKELLSSGLLGRGVVTQVQLTGTVVTIGVEQYRVCELTVQVFLDGQQPYIAAARQRLPIHVLAQIQGAVVAVRVSPQDPQQIAIDLASEAPVVTLGEPPAGQGAAHVLAVGAPGEVVLVSTTPLGMRSYKGEDIHLFTMTVMAPGQQPYQAQAGIPVPPQGLPLVFPGSKLPAKIAPGDGTQVTVDWQAALAGQP
jgi:hypothetical protein